MTKHITPAAATFIGASGNKLSADVYGEKGAPVPLPTAFQPGVSYAVALSPTLALGGALETRLTRGRSGVVLLPGEDKEQARCSKRFRFRS